MPSIQDATIMVTGGCGFIGSHLVRELHRRGAGRIIALDSLRYGDRSNLGGEVEGVEVVKFTLGFDEPSVLAAKLAGVRFLFHLAAEKHNQSKDDPLAVLRANVDGTYVLLDAAARAGVEKVVFTSSLYAYGRMSGPPFVEDEVPHPRTVYGISKLCGEHLLGHFHAEHGLAYDVLRYLFVYGPRQYAGMGYKSVIVKSFERLLAGEPPVVFGDGAQALDYVFVDDAVEATIGALESDVAGETMNVGSGAATTVRDLIALMQSVAGRSLPARNDPPDWTAGSSRVGDVAKIERLLGWRARTTLREGLEKTFRWMSEARKAGVRP
jgi:UDP-glucose 4-epimerase